MKIEKLKPLNNKKESIYVLVTVILILSFAVSLIYLTREYKEENVITSSQISSFDSFSAQESIIYADLDNFLVTLNQEGYMNLDQLVDTAPFYDENFEWKYVEDSYYLGVSKDENIGNFLVLENKVYYYKGKIDKEESLDELKSKFKEVVPLRGKDI